MATQSAFNKCVQNLEYAMGQMRTLALMPEGDQLIKALADADITLKDPSVDVVTLKLDGIFDLCKKVMSETQAFEFAQALKVLVDRYATAAGLMVQWLDPESDPWHFFLKMENLAADSGKLKWRTLDLAHDLLTDVLVAVNAAKMDSIEYKATRPYRGWQTDRDGQPARFAETFRTTPVCMAYEVWLGERPTSTANFRDIKAWIDRGYKLKDQLEAPWGMCECGKNKLLPWYDEKAGIWKVNPLCRDCYKAKNGATGKSVGQKGQGEHRQAGTLSAETIEALRSDPDFDGVNVETRRESVIGGSAVKVVEDLAEEPETDKVVSSFSARVTVNPADVDADAEVATVEKIGKKRAAPRKVRTVTPKTTDKPRNPRKKGGHPIEDVDGSLS